MAAAGSGEGNFKARRLAGNFPDFKGGNFPNFEAGAGNFPDFEGGKFTEGNFFDFEVRSGKAIK